MNLPDHDVVTLEEVSEFLRVPREVVQAEIEGGRLPVLNLGGQVRILKTDLLAFMDLVKTGRARLLSGQSGNGSSSLKSMLGQNILLEPSEGFDHMWPNGRREIYTEALSGFAKEGVDSRPVRIGFTTRPAAGKIRKRAVVFVDKRPLVEFVGADKFEESTLMVSLIKGPSGKRIRPNSSLPTEYSGFRVEPYRNYVTGPYASTNLAVVCSIRDGATMVTHALIRLRNIESRAQEKVQTSRRRRG